MGDYRYILAALDLSEESAQVLSRARAMACEGARIDLVHVVQPIATAYIAPIPGAPMASDVSDLAQDFSRAAKRQLRDMASGMDLDPEHCYVLDGKPARELKRHAENNDCDLLVIGTHSQSGMELLLGSTASGVLHGAPCDVLAVRIED